MISAISPVSGYSVQAIYGNPVSVRPVKPVSEESTANSAMMTVSKNHELEVPSQPSKETVEAKEQKAPVTSVASGGEAEIVKQLEQLQKAISKPMDTEEEPEKDEFNSIQASMSSIQNQFSNQFSSNYSDTFLQMGYSQNIRDKVSSSEAQTNVAEATQKASDYFAKTPALEEIEKMLENPTISQTVDKISETSDTKESQNVVDMLGAMNQ